MSRTAWHDVGDFPHRLRRGFDVVTELRTLWRGPFRNAELNGLHADAFDHPPYQDDWEALTRAHSLGWVTARVDVREIHE